MLDLWFWRQQLFNSGHGFGHNKSFAWVPFPYFLFLALPFRSLRTTRRGVFSSVRAECSMPFATIIVAHCSRIRLCWKKRSLHFNSILYIKYILWIASTLCERRLLLLFIPMVSRRRPCLYIVFCEDSLFLVLRHGRFIQRFQIVLLGSFFSPRRKLWIIIAVLLLGIRVVAGWNRLCLMRSTVVCRCTLICQW